MSKRKGQFEGHSFFVTTTPIERCVRQLEALNKENLDIRIIKKDPDTVLFKAQLSEQGVLRVTGEGTLKRWQGTDTRVDCDITIHEGILLWMMILAGFFIMVMVMLPLLIFIAAEINVMLWLGLSVGFLVILIMLMVLTRHYTPLDDTPRNLQQLIEKTLTTSI